MPHLIRWLRRDGTKSGFVPNDPIKDRRPREFVSIERAEAACEELNAFAIGYRYVVETAPETVKKERAK